MRFFPFSRKWIIFHLDRYCSISTYRYDPLISIQKLWSEIWLCYVWREILQYSIRSREIVQENYAENRTWFPSLFFKCRIKTWHAIANWYNLFWFASKNNPRLPTIVRLKEQQHLQYWVDGRTKILLTHDTISTLGLNNYWYHNNISL